MCGARRRLYNIGTIDCQPCIHVLPRGLLYIQSTYHLDRFLIWQDRIVRYARRLDDKFLPHAAVAFTHLKKGGQARSTRSKMPQGPDVESPAAEVAAKVYYKGIF